MELQLFYWTLNSTVVQSWFPLAALNNVAFMQLEIGMFSTGQCITINRAANGVESE